MVKRESRGAGHETRRPWKDHAREEGGGSGKENGVHQSEAARRARRKKFDGFPHASCNLTLAHRQGGIPTPKPSALPPSFLQPLNSPLPPSFLPPLVLSFSAGLPAKGLHLDFHVRVSGSPPWRGEAKEVLWLTATCESSSHVWNGKAS